MRKGFYFQTFKKSGSDSDMGNHMPISMLSVFSRKQRHDHVSNYMKKQKKFAKCQQAL